MYSPHCTVCGPGVLTFVEDSFHWGRCSCGAHRLGRSAPLGKERPSTDVRFPPSPLFVILDALTLASELGQKYATQNYPSQGTPICKLHGPRIKPCSHPHHPSCWAGLATVVGSQLVVMEASGATLVAVAAWVVTGTLMVTSWHSAVDLVGATASLADSLASRASSAVVAPLVESTAVVTSVCQLSTDLMVVVMVVVMVVEKFSVGMVVAMPTLPSAPVAPPVEWLMPGVTASSSWSDTTLPSQRVVAMEAGWSPGVILVLLMVEWTSDTVVAQPACLPDSTDTVPVAGSVSDTSALFVATAPNDWPWWWVARTGTQVRGLVVLCQALLVGSSKVGTYVEFTGIRFRSPSNWESRLSKSTTFSQKSAHFCLWCFCTLCIHKYSAQSSDIFARWCSPTIQTFSHHLENSAHATCQSMNALVDLFVTSLSETAVVALHSSCHASFNSLRLFWCAAKKFPSHCTSCANGNAVSQAAFVSTHSCSRVFSGHKWSGPSCIQWHKSVSTNFMQFHTFWDWE